MRKFVIAGNWKMNKTLPQAVTLVRDLKAGLSAYDDIDIIVCPPSIALSAARDDLQDTVIDVGSQHMHWEAEGAFTGEVSPRMVQDLCSHVIIGHSERRTHFGETDAMVNRRVVAAITHGLTPIICVGETDDENRAGKTQAVLDSQTTQALAGLSAQQAAAAIVAYEPIWAIGTGRAASPAEANDTIGLVREVVGREFGAPTAAAMRILYGGSINPGVWPDIIAQAEVDGGLVGGASLIPEDFIALAGQTSAAYAANLRS